MLNGKAQAATTPTALGSLLQASTYGAAIPIIYGTTQSPLLAIWAANLRQGGSIKKFKQLKKGITAYVENIDFLLGHNPILGVLQMWNNGGTIPLAFTTYSKTGASGAITIPDANFYAVVGVSIASSYSVTFNDYGGSGAQTFSGTTQIPLWNELFAGPDPTHGSAIRNFPFCYRWHLGYGATLYIDYPDFFTSVVTVHYAQVTSATSNQGPLAHNRLAFEPALGSGTEYSDAGLSSQQIIYPMFAGIESSSIDLGSSGALPQLQAEVQGKFGLYSSGDADFADMIEDVFKSGIAQASIAAGNTIALTQVEHGLSGYSYPGCIQSKTNATINQINQITYNMPTTAGNFLVVVICSGNATSTLGISDTTGSSWTSIFPGTDNIQAWYATAVGGACVVTISGLIPLNDNDQISAYEIAGVDTFDSVIVGHGGTAAITTTNAKGYPAYILGFGLWNVAGTNPIAPNNPLWATVLDATTGIYGAIAGGSSSPYQLILERTVKGPASYSLAIPNAPSEMGLIAFKATQPPAYPNPVGDFIDKPSLDQVRRQCHANGLYGSLSMASQQAGSDWLKTLGDAADLAYVYTGFKLYTMPLSEVSAAGNGSIYNAPTAAGPSFNLSTENGDFIVSNTSDPPIKIVTVARVDQPNVLQMQCINRTSNYNPSVVSQPDAATISLFGERKDDPIVNNAVQDVSIARQLLGIQVRKLQYGGDTYTFTLPAKWCLLAPMGAGGGGNSDAVLTITDPLASIFNLPVRITAITEQADMSLQCEAEPFVYGMYAPTPFVATTPTPYQPSVSTGAGSINAPIIFEPTPRLSRLSTQAQLWLVVSSPNPLYGGCQCYISTDGGSSYNPIGDPIIGSAITGHNTADWPAHADPDTTNNLALDLTESLGTLLSYNATARDNFQYPCYIAGGGSFSIPYEIMTYNVATLTGTNLYTLAATGSGNELRRGVYAAPSPTVGVDHATSSRWAFLNPTGQGILKLAMDPAWIGTTLYFKFPSFNNFGGAIQSLTVATAYSYTPTGVPGNAGPSSGFLINGA